MKFEPMEKPEPWAETPWVFVRRPTCPTCGCPDYVRIRTERGDETSVTRKAVCRRCSQRYRILVELPETGNGRFDDGIIQT